MKNIGLIVNPIAGMGGRVGLKGTDGFNIQQQAISLGATSEAKYRAFETLNVLSSSSSIFKLTTCSREMGEYPALKAGFKPELVYSMASGPSTANDTRIAASKMQEIGVDLLLFVGGDGTARDICDEIGEDILTLGVPSGVKIQSGVFAVTPKSAGHIVRSFIDGEITETYLRKVIDVDESNLNNDVICSTHYGFLKVPNDNTRIQLGKTATLISQIESLSSLSESFVNQIDNDLTYIIGPGRTTESIMDFMGIDNTLLGVDVIKGKELLAKDVSEQDILNIVDSEKTKIVLTIIGNQGHILGRGNQQISPQVIRAVGFDNFIVIAAKNKLLQLKNRPLLVDTGDPDLDMDLGGYIKVFTDYGEHSVHRISNPV